MEQSLDSEQIIIPKPLDWQTKVLNSKSRYKVLRCGRRTGKTSLIIYDSLSLGFRFPNLSLAYIGLTYGHAKDVVWEDYIKIAGKSIVYKNSQELLFKLSNGSRIKLYSWDSIDNMLGKKYHKVYGDEVAVAKNFWAAWDNVVQPTLLDYSGEAWLASMPRGKGAFKELCDYAAKTKDWQSFHFTSYQNTIIPNVKKELDELKNRIPKSVFAQQYLAEFTDLEGRIYTEFARDDAIDKSPFEIIKYGLSIDWGVKHPLAAYIYGIGSDDQLYIIKELYKPGITDRKEAIKNFIDEYDIEIAVADSEDTYAISEVSEILNCSLEPIKKGGGSVVSGINQVKSEFQNKRLFIHPRCVNLIDELETYSWKIDSNGKEMEAPVKVNDDGVDSLRYMVMYLNGLDTYSDDDYVSIAL